MATHEPTDDIALEVERQLQLAITAATLAARKAVAHRQASLNQARADSDARAVNLRAQLDRERILASARIQPASSPNRGRRCRSKADPHVRPPCSSPSSRRPARLGWCSPCAPASCGLTAARWPFPVVAWSPARTWSTPPCARRPRRSGSMPPP